MARNGLPTRAEFEELSRRVDELARNSIVGVVGAELHPVAGQGRHLVIPTARHDQVSTSSTPASSSSSTFFFAKITGSVSLGGNHWSYSFVEVQLRPGGLWSTVSPDPPSNGRQGTAYNLAEANNSGAGVEGNGVDSGALATNFPGFALMPAPDNAIVQMSEVSNGTAIQYWFNHANAIDGVCGS